MSSFEPEVRPGVASGPEGPREPGREANTAADRQLFAADEPEGSDAPGLQPKSPGPGPLFPRPPISGPPVPGPLVSGIDAIGPNLGHVLLLGLLSAIGVLVGQFGTLLLARQLHVFGRHSVRAYGLLLQNDARWLVPAEALGYLLVLLIAVPVFRRMWHRSFAQGLHWNSRTAVRYLGRLLLLGLGCGIGVGVLGSYLPMPKDPPIMADMMHSPLGAWMMLIFGVTGAPLFEEMVFRGFLLPACLNAFRWLTLEGDLSAGVTVWVGGVVSVALTSLPFALLHAPQVSHAWAPVLLIGLISVVLCLVRLRLNSLAGSTVVHAAYNFTLFAGILVQTDGFRHLNKLVQ